MIHRPGPHEMETASGLYVNLEDPLPETITLADIATHLSRVNRFGGAARPYPVAEHAVIVSHRLEDLGEPADVQLAGLHHDDAEAYLGDVVRPLKSALEGRYGELTWRMDQVIERALGLPHAWRLTVLRVKEADDWAQAIEAWHLLPSKGEGWSDLTGVSGADLYRYENIGMAPERARVLFLQRHHVLMARVEKAAA